MLACGAAAPCAEVVSAKRSSLLGVTAGWDPRAAYRVWLQHSAPRDPPPRAEEPQKREKLDSSSHQRLGELPTLLEEMEFLLSPGPWWQSAGRTQGRTLLCLTAPREFH